MLYALGGGVVARWVLLALLSTRCTALFSLRCEVVDAALAKYSAEMFLGDVRTIRSHVCTHWKPVSCFCVSHRHQRRNP